MGGASRIVAAAQGRNAAAAGNTRQQRLFRLGIGWTRTVAQSRRFDAPASRRSMSPRHSLGIAWAKFKLIKRRARIAKIKRVRRR
jgi:hypothetical protein